jgi:hypothetical protein
LEWAWISVGTGVGAAIGFADEVGTLVGVDVSVIGKDGECQHDFGRRQRLVYAKQVARTSVGDNFRWLESRIT